MTRAPRLRGNIHGHREPRSCAGSGGRTTGAVADRMAYQVSLASAPRSPGFRSGGTRDPATPPHPQCHPCGRGVGLRGSGHCPPGTAPPPDRSDVRAALALSPTGRPRATSVGVGRDPRLHHGQRRGFRDPRLGSGSSTAPARPPAAFRQVALALLCRARRVPGNPRLSPVETPPAIHDPIALRSRWQRRGRPRLASGTRKRDRVFTIVKPAARSGGASQTPNNREITHARIASDRVR